MKLAKFDDALHLETYLNFQQVIVANAFVVHLMICIIGVTTTLILNEREPPTSVNYIRAVSSEWVGIYALTDD